MRKVYQLYQADQIAIDGFGKIYRPLEDRERSLAAELPKLQRELDALEMRQLSSDEVVTEAVAVNLYRSWPEFTTRIGAKSSKTSPRRSLLRAIRLI
jgi:hypothetical protein